MIGKIKKMLKEKAGVSPIIAIILMVAITVVLAATIYVWVSGFGGGGSKAMSMAITQLDSISDDSATFRVDSVSQGALWENIEISIVKSDGTILENGTDFTVKSSSTTTYPSGAINAGEVFTIQATNTIDPGDILQFKDKTSNSIFLTKVLW